MRKPASQLTPEQHEAEKKRRREWMRAHPEKRRQWHKRWRANNYEHAKAWHRDSLTQDQYNALVQQACGICGRKTKMRVVDHDHKTGIVRGALCRFCNARLGWFGGFRDQIEAWLLRGEEGVQ